MINDDELLERFRALARTEADNAPPFYSEETAMRRSLERRRRERKLQHPLLTSRRLATVTASTLAIVVVLAFGLAWGTNTPMKRALTATCHALALDR